MHARHVWPAKVFYKKTDQMQSELASVFEPWRESIDTVTPRPLWVYWVNLPVVGYLGAMKLEWLTDYITAKLHEMGDTSMCILLQTNRSGDDTLVKTEEDDMNGSEDDTPVGKARRTSSSGWNGCTRMGSVNAIRLMKQKIVDTFCEEGRKLQVVPAIMTFDPPTVWGARSETHDMILLTSNNSQNVWHRSRLWRRHVCSNVPMLARRSMVKPTKVKEGVLTVDTDLTLVQRWKQATCMSIKSLVAQPR